LYIGPACAPLAKLRPRRQHLTQRSCDLRIGGDTVFDPFALGRGQATGRQDAHAE
jgi:hypothetical protein